ncbi:MAG: ankyrin repeat domain-containing protein [Ruminococcus sp.]|nr:ankyrin repeat domain-containing protein [Ruminococcus sp.]
MDSKRIKALLMAGVTLFVSGCSAISESGYVGYMKNEVKFGKGVTRQFQQAVARANIEWLDEILTEYPDYNVNYYGDSEIKYQGYEYETLKVICIENSISYVSEDKMLRYLIGKGLDPNLKFSDGYYALDRLCADYKNKPYLVNTLLEYGVDPNNANTAGFYNVDLGELNKDEYHLPIFWAIYEPMYNNAEELLKNGATVNFEILDKIRGKYDTINGSAKSYQLAFKSYLEKTGESPFTKAEEYAILGESDKLIEELKSGNEIDDNTAVTVRYFICRFCNVEAIKAWDKIFLERNILADNYYKYKPENQLCAAASEGNYEIVKYLIDNGVESLPYETSYKEPLVYAAQSGSYDVCKILVDNDYYVEASDCAEVLEAAYQGGNIETFRLLANYFNKDDLITEKMIRQVFCDEIVEWNDFTNGVIDCLMNECGLNMIAFESINMDYETMKYLFDKGKQLSVFDLPNAIASQNSQMVEYILEQGADPNQGVYLFGVFSEENRKMLLPYEDALSALDTNNSECIKYAIRYGTSEIVQMLIDHGADLSDESILACAITDSSKATFDALFNAGASLDYKNDKSKETLVDIAKSMGRNDIVKILRKAGVKGYGGF